MATDDAEQALALPPSDRGATLLSIDENQWFDRKSNRASARDLADAMIGFANAEGGMVVIGLWNGRVEGVGGAPAGRMSDWRQASLDFVRPPVRCRFEEIECVTDAGSLDSLAVVVIERSEQVHANDKDEVFLRVGDENRKLAFAQRQELLYDKGQASFEGSSLRDAAFGDLDEHVLGEYAEVAGSSDPTRLLAARGLMTGSGDLTAGAVLLFGLTPERWFPEAHVRVLRYAGVDRGTGARQQLLDDVRIGGPITSQLTRARQAVLERLPTRRALGPSGRFESVSVVPEGAWLEGVVNAAIHRSYSISGDHIRVDIFDDRLEIESPGRFPGVAEGRDPLHVTRFARNPRIARVCADLGFGQELGEGIRRIYDEMRAAGLADPVYTQTAGSVRLTLTSTAVDREQERQLPPVAREVLRVLREAGRASTGDLVSATGRSRPVVLAQLRSLEAAGVVAWVGHSKKDPHAYWTLA